MEKLITFISLFDETKSKIDIESTLFSANQLIIRNSNLVDFYVIIDEKNYLENSILINKYEANIKFLKFEKNLIFNYFLTIKNVIPLIKTKFWQICEFEKTFNLKNSFEFLKNLKEKNEEVILFNFFEMNNSSLNFKENNQVIKGDKLKLSKINQTQINFDCCFKTETTLNQIQQIFDLKLNLFYLHYFIFLNLNNWGKIGFIQSGILIQNFKKNKMNNHSLTKFDFTNHIKSIFLQVSNFNFDLENTIVKKSLENFMKAILKASYVFLMRNIEKSEIKKEIWNLLNLIYHKNIISKKTYQKSLWVFYFFFLKQNLNKFKIK